MLGGGKPHRAIRSSLAPSGAVLTIGAILLGKIAGSGGRLPAVASIPKFGKMMSKLSFIRDLSARLAADGPSLPGF
jgi:hypothetical protein